MDKKFGIFAFVFVLLCAVLGGLLGGSRASSAVSSVTAGQIQADYREAVDIIERNYVSEVNHEEISEKSIQSMLWTLDPHSSFFTAEEFRKLYEDQSSQFYGIGVSIIQHKDGVYVQSVIPNTPADKAGIRYGDRFVNVDGKDAKEWTSSEVSKNVRGEKGTSVKVQVERPSSDKPIEFTITRGGVPLPSIRNHFMLPSGVGYIGLTGGFQETTSEELDAAMADLKKQGMKSLILDLRNNPGGLLTQAREVVSRFVPEGKTVVSVKGRTSYVEKEELRTNGEADTEIPLVVMINGASASASEIVAGAVQDYGRGVIVGADSFGKGLVQRVFPLPFGAGLTLTTARYYTPFGRSLQRDYSNGSIYEYYTHSNGEEGGEGVAPKPAGSPVTTANGRTLYGGRGIEPDVLVKSREFTPVRGRLIDAAFYFVRRMAYGQIRGLESYKAERQSFAQTVSANDVIVSDKILDAFKAFVAADKSHGLTSAMVDSDAEYARVRIRQEMATALYSNEAGNQVLIESDPQILKALESMAEAARFAAVKS